MTEVPTKPTTVREQALRRRGLVADAPRRPTTEHGRHPSAVTIGSTYRIVALSSDDFSPDAAAPPGGSPPRKLALAEPAACGIPFPR
jgi:hypothetical protein